MKLLVLLAGSLLLFPCLRAQDTGQSVLEGYITRAPSSSDFDVNGEHVLCANARATHELSNPDGAHPGCPTQPIFIGESMRISGARNRRQHAFEAGQIIEVPAAMGEISGQAVIDAIPAQNAFAAGELLVRADGYRIHIGAKTAIAWTAPLKALADVKPGDWIEYKGARNSEGTINAESVAIKPESVSRGEEKLRKKTDFDPANASQGHEQGAVSMALVGINPKGMPPHNDAAMQARVTRIGESLIPAYQRSLSDSDPARIHFRFQVVDSKVWWDALTMPSGLILVPAQVVERMQNDDQLAAVLADNIATAIESQDYRNLHAAHALTAGNAAAQIAGIFIPGVGLAGWGATAASAAAMRTRAEEQSGRVALGLMHDAGYDIRQAPLAWWLLGKKKAAPIAEIPLPTRAAYLYRMIGENWREDAMPASQASMPAAAPSGL
jgi:Peptidase family M48